MLRRGGPSGVRGPNSALTEFLRNEGITDAFRQRRANEQSQNNRSASASTAASEEPEEVLVSPVRRRTRNTIVVDEDDEEVEQIKLAAKKKLRAAKKSDRKRKGDGGGDSSSDSDVDDDYVDDSDAEFKKFGDTDTCAQCNQTFHLTVYSRFVRDKNGYICENCNLILKAQERKSRKNQLSARKKRKKVAAALLNKTRVAVPSLQDVCIKKIAQNIQDVDALGDIGQMNLNKISMILSKNRSLDDSTINLFLNPGLKHLEFWDCSNVSSDSLNKIASFCPNLESLTLFMCGQLHNDNLKYYQTNLKNLLKLALNGAFLISGTMWQEYFETCGSNLATFELRNTHRFTNDSLISLLENAGKSLTSLKLSRLDGLDSAPVYELIPHYLQLSQVTHLELSYPHSEELITDDLIIDILSITGETLTHLNLDGCSGLTDKFLIDGIAKFCPNLTHLSLKHLDRLTDEGFASAFQEFKNVNHGGLISVDLTKCVELGDEAVYELFKHSSHTLVELVLNSVDRITKEFLLQICTDDFHPSKQSLKRRIEEESSEEKFYEQITLPLLTTFDFGFVRAVDDEVLLYIGELCPRLSILEVYGDNRCTSRAKFREGILVIGRQNDEI